MPIICRSYNNPHVSYLDSRGGYTLDHREELVTNLTASKVGDETRASEMFGDPCDAHFLGGFGCMMGVWVYTNRYAPPRFEAFKSFKIFMEFYNLEK